MGRGMGSNRASMMRFHRARFAEVTLPVYDAQAGEETVSLISTLEDEDGAKVGERYTPVYTACKAGVNSLAKSFVHEFSRDKIRFNTVCPGVGKIPKAIEFGFLTPEREAKISKAYPLGRITEISDVVNATVFLASDLASFITAQSVSVSGGYTTV